MFARFVIYGKMITFLYLLEAEITTLRSKTLIISYADRG